MTCKLLRMHCFDQNSVEEMKMSFAVVPVAHEHDRLYLLRLTFLSNDAIVNCKVNSNRNARFPHNLLSYT